MMNTEMQRRGLESHGCAWRMFFTLVVLLTLKSVPTFAALHYINASAAGTGSGNDWANAYTSIPATLVRGDTYYIAGGTYGTHTFSAQSGTTYVYLQKATVADHGTATGWSDSYGTSQAVFSSSSTVFVVHMSYLSIDGVTGSGTSGHGIKLVTSGSSSSSDCCIYSYASAPDGLTLKHIECQAATPNGNLPTIFNIGPAVWPGPANTLFQYCYIHGGLVAVLFTGSNQVIDHCYLANVGGQQHSEIICAANVQNLTIRYNVLENLVCCSGTTYIEPQSNGGTAPNGIYIYGNVFKATRSDEQTTNPSALSSTSGELVQNVFIYNNTFYGLHGSPPSIGMADTGVRGDNASSTVTVRNTLWQNCTYPPGFQSVQVQDHNLLNTGGASFANAAAGDFHLTANTSPGLALGSPYNIDPDGNVRTTWSLGAYEYGVNTNPVASVSPSSLSFGSVTVGTTSNMNLTIQNAGSGTLAGTATVSAPFSIVSGATYTLGANQSQTVKVSFNPTATGSTNGTVTFTGGGGAAAPATGLGVSVNNQPPTVSPIAQNATDVDPGTKGLQVYQGTVVQYSGSASDPNGDPLTWQWIYTVNGGAETVLASGSGTVTPVSYSYSAGTAGSTYVWKLRVSDGMATSESTLTVGVEAAPLPAGTLSFSATAGTISAPFVVASGAISQAVTTDLTTGGGGQAVYNFTLTNSGSFVVQALVNAPDTGANSFYLNIDAQPQDPLMIWDVTTTSGFEQRLVSWRGNGTSEVDQYVPEIFSLAAGAHQLIIIGREAGAQLQTLSILQLPPPPQNLRVVSGF